MSRVHIFFFFLIIRRPPRSTLFPLHDALPICCIGDTLRIFLYHPVKLSKWQADPIIQARNSLTERPDRKSTRLNSSHANISYAVFCLKKKKQKYLIITKTI